MQIAKRVFEARPRFRSDKLSKKWMREGLRLGFRREHYCD
jgi:hypothetical protein